MVWYVQYTSDITWMGESGSALAMGASEIYLKNHNVNRQTNTKRPQNRFATVGFYFNLKIPCNASVSSFDMHLLVNNKRTH